MSEKGLRGKINWLVTKVSTDVQHLYGMAVEQQAELLIKEITDQILSAVVEALPKEEKFVVHGLMRDCPKKTFDCQQACCWNAYREAAIAAIKGGE